MSDSGDLQDIQHELQAVLGYYELGMWAEAQAEIDEVEGRLGSRPEIDELRLVVYQGAKQWVPMRDLARQCVERYPSRSSWFISLAYAVRRAESIPAARKILEAAAALHPKEPLIPFNLACYAAQLGDLDDARNLLDRAVHLDPKLRKNAEEDPDLAPIRKAAGTADAASRTASDAVPDAVPGGTPAGTRPAAPHPLPAVPAALRVYARNLVEGDSASRAVALHALVEARAEGVFVSLLGSGEPAVVQLASRGLWECWLNEAGSPARKQLEKGVAAMDKANFDEAEKLFGTLVGRFPKWAEAVNKLATLCYLERRYAEGLELCRKVVALKPDHFGAWQGMTLCAIQVENWAAALEGARNSLRLQPQDAAHAELVKSLEEKVERPGR